MENDLSYKNRPVAVSPDAYRAKTAIGFLKPEKTDTSVLEKKCKLEKLVSAVSLGGLAAMSYLGTLPAYSAYPPVENIAESIALTIGAIAGINYLKNRKYMKRVREEN